MLGRGKGTPGWPVGSGCADLEGGRVNFGSIGRHPSDLSAEAGGQEVKESGFVPPATLPGTVRPTMWGGRVHGSSHPRTQVG